MTSWEKRIARIEAKPSKRSDSREPITTAPRKDDGFSKDLARGLFAAAEMLDISTRRLKGRK